MFKVGALTGFGAGGGAPIAILLSDLGNINSTAGTSATFASVDVGTGADRTLIVMASAEDADTTTTTLTTCTVDGNSMTLSIEIHSGGTPDMMTAIFIKKLSTETGSISIVVGASAECNSWGMSAIVVTGLNSVTPFDSESDNNPGTSIAATGFAGPVNGIAVGAVAVDSRSETLTWGSSLTERADLQTGGNSDDHRHGAAYDLLPAGRAAATETVAWSGTNNAALSVASFR